MQYKKMEPGKRRYIQLAVLMRATLVKRTLAKQLLVKQMIPQLVLINLGSKFDGESHTSSNWAVMFSVCRRKLRAEVGKAFLSLSDESLLSEIIPNKEEMSVMRIMSHSGQAAVAYCVSGEPVFFEVQGKIFPTGEGRVGREPE